MFELKHRKRLKILEVLSKEYIRKSSHYSKRCYNRRFNTEIRKRNYIDFIDK